MAISEAMYYKAALLPVEGDDSESQRNTRSRFFKVGVAVLAGSCVMLLGVMALSAHSTGGTESTTSLFGMTSALRKPAPVVPQRTALNPTALNQLPGAGPWKDLALAGLEAANQCDSRRDISAKAMNGMKAALSKMDGKQKAVVQAVGKEIQVKASNAETILNGAGVFPPLGFFDPLGFSANLGEQQLLFYREAELKHGRVCMLASLGFVVGERFHPLFGGDIDVPSYVAFQQTPLQQFWILVSIAIAIPEVLYSIPSFVEPSDDGVYKDINTWAMKTGRVPGDIGFDPLGLKPSNPDEFVEMQNKELAHARLAMIATAGAVAEQLVTGDKLSGFDFLR
jgi:hypothetical protein